MKRVTILGSTGSIGQNTLKVIDQLGDPYQVFGLAARKSVSVLAEQSVRYRPQVVVLADPASAEPFRSECRRLGGPTPEVLVDRAGLTWLAASTETDVVVSAIVGAAGLESAHAALSAGRTLALANKEALVVAGELLKQTAEANDGTILPVDSEHSAIDQCLRSGGPDEVKRLILTASGGPFLKTPATEFSGITPEQALRHPTWSMGPRITVDSATLMNKGFEVIEARWLFDVDAENIDVVIHPQSIVHSMVEYVDGSVLAQLGTTDMRGPIQYALTYPERRPSASGGLDWASVPNLEFLGPDQNKFPALSLAYRSLEMGGTATAVLNASDEVAVEMFLDRKIRFPDVTHLIEQALDAHSVSPANSLEAVLEADSWARDYTRDLADRVSSTAG